MVIPQTAHYIKKSEKDAFLGVAQAENFFCVISIDTGYTKEQGADFITQLEEEVQHVSLSQLVKFESWLSDVIKQGNVPAQVSLAAGALYEDILYLKTIGDGQIYLKRKDHFAKLIEGDKSASGHIKPSDFILFTTKSFSDNFPKENELKHLIENKTPEEIVPAIETYETDIDEKDCVALFVLNEKKPQKDMEIDSKPHHTHKEHDIHSPIIVEDPSHLDPPGYSSHPPTDIQVISSSFTDTLAGDAETDEADSTQETDSQTESESDKKDTPSVHDVSSTFSPHTQEPLMESDEDQSAPSKEKKQRIKINMKELFASAQSWVKHTIFSRDMKKKFRSKKVLIGIAIGVLFLLGLSIYFSNQKLQQQKIREKIKTSQETITEKLTQAEEISFLNPERSVILLTEARDELNTLTSTLSQEEKKQVQEELTSLSKKIDNFEEEILQKEEKEYTEFYDLSLEAQDAKGTNMFLFENRVAIADSGNNTIYVISLEDKYLEKRKSQGIKEGTIPALFKDDILFYTPQKGVYRFINEQGDIEQLIKYSEDWGTISDIAMYYGNIYLLDTEKDDIYKFVLVENGYGGGESYFLTPHNHDFSSARGMTIDASIYVALKDQILKFTRGEDDEFNTTFPYEDVNLTDLYTDEESGNVYAWDKTQGSIYVLDKNGRYEREIYAEMLTKADDLIVYQNNIYVLSGSKIYLIEDEL